MKGGKLLPFEVAYGNIYTKEKIELLSLIAPCQAKHSYLLFTNERTRNPKSARPTHDGKHPTACSRLAYASLFVRLRVVLSAASFSAITSRGSVSVRALVPTSSRLRTLTERLSSSSCPTTAKTSTCQPLRAKEERGKGGGETHRG